MLRLLLATRNSHKTREFAQILGGDCEISDLVSAPEIPEVAENGRSFEENAIAKAVEVSRLVSGFVIADDSGLEVAALGGAPGVYSARYAGERANDQQNIAKLLAELSRIGRDDVWEARFCCAIALSSHGELITVFRGDITGSIVERPRGDHGFGYDSIFVPTGYQQTFAELGSEVKNRISHRTIAIVKLRHYLTRTHDLPTGDA